MLSRHAITGLRQLSTKATPSKNIVVVDGKN